MQAAQSLPPFHLLGQWSKKVFALVLFLEKELGPGMLNVLLKTCCSLGGRAAKLAEQLHDAERLSLSGRPFRYEEDRIFLVATARPLEFLREGRESRSRLITTPQSWTVLLESCSEFVQRTERNLEAIAV